MTIQDDLAAEMRDAMRARDRGRLDVIRQVETEVARAKSEPGFAGEIDDVLYRRCIASYSRKMEKARREYEDLGEPGAGQAAKLAFEVEYLSRWLPKSLGEDETRPLVKDAIAELGAESAKEMGRVVGHVMRSGREGLDGGLVSRLAEEELGGG